ncbi:MAG TPA: oxygenase MpaB family protein [Solirubrobacteraceae bacterium]|nr:oxygenase MpaB family protein [Solirubrobacteraceae bacterium]
MGDAGYFNARSLLRVVHREQVVALSGARALLMQAAHPVAFEGFLAQTGSLSEPYERLARTARVLDTIGFGTKEQADRATARVRAIHRRVHGELAHSAGRFPAGTHSAADDPELLLWILACLADSAQTVYERYVRGLSARERESYWQDYRTIGRLFGLKAAQMPAGHADFRAYMHTMIASDDLFVTDAARDLGIQIVLRPPAPLAARPLLELANFVTVGLLPARIRRAYRLGWDPARELALRGGAEYAKRVIVPLLPARLRLISPARSATAA